MLYVVRWLRVLFDIPWYSLDLKTGGLEISEPCYRAKYPAIVKSVYRSTVQCFLGFSVILGGGFKYVLFSSLFGVSWSNLTNIFQMGWNHQLEFHLMFERSQANTSGFFQSGLKAPIESGTRKKPRHFPHTSHFSPTKKPGDMKIIWKVFGTVVKS